MNWKSLFYILIGIGCVGLLIFLYGVADPISKDNTGFLYQVEQAVKAGIIGILALVITRFVTIFFWDPMEKRRGKPVSRILKDIVMLLVYAIAGIFILVVVYGKSATGVWASLLTASGCVAYAGIDFIKDCIAGIILDFTGSFKPGDWVHLPSGTNAQVNKVQLMSTEFLLINGTSLSLSNSKILTYDIINYNDSVNGYWGDLAVTLDSSVPVPRAKRLLQAATAAAPQVHGKEAKVLANQVHDGAVTYKVLYKVPSFALRNIVLHNVIQSIMKHLKDHNLSITDGTSYVYTGQPAAAEVVEAPQTSAFEAAALSPLFAGCSPEELEKIASVLRLRHFRSGDVLIAEKTTGTTMFFLAEGVVEISIQIPTSEPDDEEQTFQKKHITYLVTNDFFGEGGVLREAQRNATVSAFTDVIAYELEKADLKKILQELPEVLIKMSEAMINRQQETADIAHKTQLSLQDKKKLTSEFANALKNFLGLK